MSEQTINCKVHGTLSLDKTVKAGMKDGEQKYRCKICKYIVQRRHYAKYPERNKDRVYRFKQNNPERAKEIKTKAHAKYEAKVLTPGTEASEKRKKWRHEYDRNMIDGMSDFYVAKLITNRRSVKGIDQRLIDVKRMQLKISRLIKQKTKERRNNDDKKC